MKIETTASATAPIYDEMEKEQHADNQRPRSLISRLLSPEKFLSRFSRVTTGRSVIPEIEGLRFYSLAVIMFFHLVVNLSIKASERYTIPGQEHWVPQFLQLGAHAVELFFVISGFILACPFAAYYLKDGRPINLKSYFLRRLTRLEPPYFLIMIGFFALMILTYRGTFLELLPHLGASLPYLHNIVYSDKSIINVVAWSLEVEIQFYVMVPIIAMVFRVRNKLYRRALIVAIGTLSMNYQWLFIAPGDRMYLSIVRFLHFFLLGFLLADVYLFDWKGKPTLHWKWDLVTIIGWPTLLFIWNTPELSYFFSTAGHSLFLDAYCFPLFTFYLYCAVFRGVITNRILTNIWITTIGGMCYTIYLFHNKLIGFLVEYTGRLTLTGNYSIDLLLQILMVMPLVFILSALYFSVIERPCMRKDWPQRLWSKVRTAFTPATGNRVAVTPEVKVATSVSHQPQVEV